MITAYYYSPFYMFWDPTYWLIIAGAVLSLLASARVNSVFRKYSGVRSRTGMTGAEAARRILMSQGITDVRIERVNGKLTDHYDSKNKVLRLSDSVFDSASVAAVGVAAHECGHAVQHQMAYVPLTLRSALVPVANFGSMLSWPLIIAGILLSWNQTLIMIGIILFSAVVLFQLVTLPVEFNASGRAAALLADNGILYQEEVKDVKRVLGAAALTYVAGAAAGILQLLRLLILFGGRNRDGR